MWNSRKSWWAKKAEENRVDKTHYKDWCVVEVYQFVVENDPRQWSQTAFIVRKYKPCAKLNAPKIYDSNGIMSNTIAVDNLTKQEAHEIAKGLNFLDGGKCE